MQPYIPFPDIGTALFEVELFGMTFALRYYALAYIIGLLIGAWIVRRLMRTPVLWPQNRAPMAPEATDDLLTYMIIGVILGGRLGYVLFYEPARFIADPAAIIRVWEGGMAFHGGMAGVAVALILFCRTRRIPVLNLADALALAAPLGLMLGRLANFTNAELWGRPTTAPWGVLFPGDQAQTCPPWWEGVCARHPSQLYEAALEGLLLFAILLLAKRAGAYKYTGRMAGIFLTGYGLARFFVEYFRQPDAQFISADNPIGFVLRAGDLGITMGQLLSLPMVALGLAFILWSRRRT